MIPSYFENAPTIEEVSPPVSISPHSDYFGQIHLVEASLIKPYYDLCQYAFDNLSEEEIYKCGLPIRTIQRARGQVHPRKETRSPPRAARGADSDNRDRPAIVCPPPATPSSPSAEKKAWLFLMGTFNCNRTDALPVVLKEFAVLVHTRNLSKEEAEESIHTTPSWDANGKPAWVVVIPITTIDGLLPAKRWEGNGAMYRVDEENYNKLMAKSRELIEEFNTQARDPRMLIQFINALGNRRHENGGSYVATINVNLPLRAQKAPDAERELHHQRCVSATCNKAPTCKGSSGSVGKSDSGTGITLLNNVANHLNKSFKLLRIS